MEFRVGNSSEPSENSICSEFNYRVEGEIYRGRMWEFTCEPPLKGTYVSMSRTCFMENPESDEDPNGYAVMNFCELEAYGIITCMT